MSLMNTRSLVVATATSAALLLGAAPASAAFVAEICGNASCTGTSFTATDNGPGDVNPILGAIALIGTLDGYNVLVNLSQSKPVLGSATAPQMDLNFTVTSGPNAATGTPAPTGSVFMFASDTGFVSGANPVLLTIGGTNSGGSGTVNASVWGGNSNTALDTSHLIGSLGPFTAAAFSGIATDPFAPSTSPFSVTLGVDVTRTTAGTTTGDFNMSAVPESSTWAMMILGFVGIGFMAYRKRPKSTFRWT
jgi:hypothetical protein